MNPVVVNPKWVFVNIPYDRRYHSLYLALISGICSHGLLPRATVEIPGGERRLDRILDLIRGCRYSIHDLSRVQIDRKPPPTPRFNMPFELGLAVAWAHMAGERKCMWAVMEAMDHRISKSLSDLAGSDAYIHGGIPRGVFRELRNVFVLTQRRPPTIAEMEDVFTAVRNAVPSIKRETGSETIYSAAVFHQLVIFAKTCADERIS